MLSPEFDDALCTLQRLLRARSLSDCEVGFVTSILQRAKRERCRWAPSERKDRLPRRILRDARQERKFPALIEECEDA